ncbi:MAG: 2'-5' RNA ligase family protein [Chloroflexi bacterium]|nr:2'-5' RNA ligase family protein [Chloroflexota bacterium]
MESRSQEQYAVVAFAPRDQIEDLRKVRAQSGMPPAMDLHVTLRRPFAMPVHDGQKIALDALRRAVQGFPPFGIRTSDAEVIAQESGHAIILPLEESPNLLELRRRVGQELARRVGIPIGDGGQRSRPHATIIGGIRQGDLERSLTVVRGWRLNYSWIVREIDLIVRADGGLWRSVAHFPFGRP